MKRILLLTFIAFSFSVLSHGQINKGAIFVGGNVNASIQKTETTISSLTGVSKTTSVFISPSFGKTIRKNLIIGAQATFGFSNSPQSNNNIPSSATRSNTYGLSVYLRKYQQVGNSNFYLFGQGGVGGNYLRDVSKGVDFNLNPLKETVKSYVANVYVYPGVSYGLSKRFQLEAGFASLFYISYINSKREVESTSPYENRNHGFNVGANFENLGGLYIGFRVLLNKA